MMNADRVVYCSRCGQANAVDARFCSNCGGGLQQRSQQQSQPPQQSYPPQQPQTQPQYAAPPPPPPPPQPRSGGRGWLVTCGVILALLACLSVVAVTVGWFYGDQILAWIQEPPAPNGGAATVTGQQAVTVSSGQAGTVTHQGGARLEIPSGAVPPTDAGEQGQMVFSIETDDTRTVSLPEGLSAVGPVYSLGPEGFTFALPIEVQLPIPDGVDPSGVRGVTFFDTVSGLWELMPAAVDVEARTVTFETTHFSFWSLWGAWESHDRWLRENGGWIEVTNPHRYNSGTYPGGRRLPMATWYGVCIQQYTLDDPSDAGSWRQPRDWKIGARDESTNRYWLPPGRYNLIEYYGRSEVNHSPLYVPEYDSFWRPIGDYVLGAGETLRFSPQGFETEAPDVQSGQPPCWGEVTTSAGTGDVQVTLTWHSEADIDLHVIDPNGDEVYYNNKVVPSGGELDRDNMCIDFILGRPENVYWPAGQAPSGEYRVDVHYYEDCSGVGPVEWTVRTVVMGEVNTYSGVLSSQGEEQVVTTFVVP